MTENTGKTVMGSLEWLREHARFECICCSEIAVASRLRLEENGWQVCECWDSIEGTGPAWRDLPPFDPFAKIEEALSLLREVAEHQWVSIDARGRPMDVTMSDDLIRRIVQAAKLREGDRGGDGSK